MFVTSARGVSLDRKMALLRAAADQLLTQRTAPWLQSGLRILSRSFAAQAQPVDEEEGAYVVTGRILLAGRATVANWLTASTQSYG